MTPSHRRRLIQSGDLWILLAVAVVLALFFLDWIRPLAQLLYSPVAFAIAVVMLLEFLFLKARDRSRQLRVEIQMMKNRRREDIRLLRQTRDTLNSARETIESIEGDGLSDEAQTRLREVGETLEQATEEITR